MKQHAELAAAAEAQHFGQEFGIIPVKLVFA